MNSISGQLANLEGAVAFGHITVHDYSLDAPGWQFEQELILDVVFQDDSCNVEVADSTAIENDELQVEPGQVIAFDFVNRTDEAAGMGIDPVPSGITTQHLEEEALADVRPRSVDSPLALSAVEPGARTRLAAVMPRGSVSVTCFILDAYADGSTANLPAAFPALIITPEATDD